MTAISIIDVLLRAVHVAALLSLFGTLLFMLVIASGEALHLRNVLSRLARVSAVCALFCGLAWLVVETAVIADADNLANTLSALPVVAFRTQYGQWLVFRCVLLIALTALPLRQRPGFMTALVLAGTVLAVQPLLGHAGAIGGGIGVELIASEALHLLAAGAWLGGLLPLFIAVSLLPYGAAATACRGFTPIGLASVLLLAGTAILQVTELMGGLPGLLGTGYGHAALLKLALFIVLLLFAALNRLMFTERLAQTVSRTARWHMRASIAIEMMLGIAVIITAAYLASLNPGTHEQPVWPLTWRLSTEALNDPFLQRELIPALVATGLGFGIAVAGLIWRRVRWYGLALALIILVLAIPHLDLLLVEAYPTSFFMSPTEFAATAITHGARVFAANCVACHGADGRGDGPNAKSLPVPPADLTAPHFWAHSEGELYWFISHGFTAPNGSVTMPPFGGVLSSEAIWDLIDYLRAHNDGTAMQATGNWPQPLPVPQFDALCPHDQAIDLDDLRGHALRIVAADGGERDTITLPPELGVTSILVAPNSAAKPSDTTCVASEPQAWQALAILLGVSADALAGAEVLADGNGWLRAAWWPDTEPSQSDQSVLVARIRDILTHPIGIVSHTHHH